MSYSAGLLKVANVTLGDTSGSSASLNATNATIGTLNVNGNANVGTLGYTNLHAGNLDVSGTLVAGGALTAGSMSTAGNIHGLTMDLSGSLTVGGSIINKDVPYALSVDLSTIQLNADYTVPGLPSGFSVEGVELMCPSLVTDASGSDTVVTTLPTDVTYTGYQCKSGEFGVYWVTQDFSGSTWMCSGVPLVNPPNDTSNFAPSPSGNLGNTGHYMEMDYVMSTDGVLSFTYILSSEASFDNFRLLINGLIVFTDSSGSGHLPPPIRTYTTSSLKAGDVVAFMFNKNNNKSMGYNCLFLKDLTITTTTLRSNTLKTIQLSLNNTTLTALDVNDVKYVSNIKLASPLNLTSLKVKVNTLVPFNITSGKLYLKLLPSLGITSNSTLDKYNISKTILDISNNPVIKYDGITQIDTLKVTTLKNKFYGREYQTSLTDLSGTDVSGQGVKISFNYSTPDKLYLEIFNKNTLDAVVVAEVYNVKYDAQNNIVTGSGSNKLVYVKPPISSNNYGGDQVGFLLLYLSKDFTKINRGVIYFPFNDQFWFDGASRMFGFANAVELTTQVVFKPLSKNPNIVGEQVSTLPATLPPLADPVRIYDSSGNPTIYDSSGLPIRDGSGNIVQVPYPAIFDSGARNIYMGDYSSTKQSFLSVANFIRACNCDYVQFEDYQLGYITPDNLEEAYKLKYFCDRNNLTVLGIISNNSYAEVDIKDFNPLNPIFNEASGPSYNPGFSAGGARGGCYRYPWDRYYGWKRDIARMPIWKILGCKWIHISISTDIGWVPPTDTSNYATERAASISAAAAGLDYISGYARTYGMKIIMENHTTWTQTSAQYMIDLYNACQDKSNMGLNWDMGNTVDSTFNKERTLIDSSGHLYYDPSGFLDTSGLSVFDAMPYTYILNMKTKNFYNQHDATGSAFYVTNTQMTADNLTIDPSGGYLVNADGTVVLDSSSGNPKISKYVMDSSGFWIPANKTTGGYAARYNLPKVLYNWRHNNALPFPKYPVITIEPDFSSTPGFSNTVDYPTELLRFSKAVQAYRHQVDLSYQLYGV